MAMLHDKRAGLIVHQEVPFNAESGLAALAEGPLTATDAFYVRGHGPVPKMDAADGGPRHPGGGAMGSGRHRDG